MNIFVTSECPITSAWSLDDKRIIKMVLETAQLLSTAVRISVPEKDIHHELYKLSHANHPCAVWTRQSQENFWWLVGHGVSLSHVFSRVYNKEHKSFQTILNAACYWNKIPKGGLTPFVNCTPFKELDDVIDAYHLYLNQKWDNDTVVPTWKDRVPPFWKSYKVIN